MYLFTVASGAFFEHGSVDFFHKLSPALILTIMTNLTQFIYRQCKLRRKSQPTHWLRWRPAYLMALSTVMVSVQPMSVLILSSWTNITPSVYWAMCAYPGDKKWRQGAWVPQVFCTWLGFIVMFVAMCEAMLLHKKLQARWRAIRSAKR